MNKSIRFILVTVLAIIAGTFYVSAQELNKLGYAPLTKGLSLTYANYDDDGEFSGSYIMKVVSANLVITETEKVGEIIFDQHFFDEDNEPVLSGDNNLQMIVTVGPEGHFSQMKEFRKLMKVKEAVSKGDASSIPDDIQVGTIIPDGVMNVSAGNMDAKILTSDRKVVREERISTPAGEFDTFVVAENQVTKAIVSIEYRLETWYAKGIGAVKQVVYDRKGRLKMSQVLTSYKIEQ